MDYQTLTYDVADDIALITLNRPDVMNALNTQMRAEIQHAVAQAGRKAACRGVHRGRGARFVRARIWAIAAMAPEPTLSSRCVMNTHPMLRAITDCPVPTIAAVNGAAAGAGANLRLGRCGDRGGTRVFHASLYAHWPDP